MRLNRPLDKVFSSEIKVRALRIFSQNQGELSGRQIAAMAGVTPKTAHEILQDLLVERILVMRIVGKTHLFRLEEEQVLVKDVLRPLFAAENILRQRLFDNIRIAVKRSKFKDNIISIAVFGSVHEKTERPTSDVDLLVIIKAAKFKVKVEGFFSDLDEKMSGQWGNLLSPYVNTLAEFKNKAKQKTGAISEILKSYQLIYGERLEKLLR